MSLHDSLHVGSPTVLASDEDAWGFVDSGADNNLFNLVTEDILHEFAKWFESGLFFFVLLLFLFGFFEVETFFGARLELLAIVVLQLLNHVFINWVNKVENFVTSLLEGFEEW